MSNSIERQVESLPTLVRELQHSMLTKVDALETMRALSGGAILLSGSGDSLAACLAAVEVLREFAGSREVVVCEPEDIARVVAELLSESDEPPLIVAVSESGESGELLSALDSVRLEVKSIALTNAPASTLTTKTDGTLLLDMDPGERSPGLRSYVGSVIGLVTIGYVLLNDVTEAASTLEAGFAELLAEVTFCVDELLPRQSAALDSWAAAASECVVLDVIADGADGQGGRFVSAKATECIGVLSTVVDSEAWCHTNAFATGGLAAVVLLGPGIGSAGRVRDTARAAHESGVPCLVVNGSGEEIGLPHELPFTLPSAAPSIFPHITFWAIASVAVARIGLVRGQGYFGGCFEPVSGSWDADCGFTKLIRSA